MVILPEDIIDYIVSQFGRERPRPRDLLVDYHSVWTWPLVDRQYPVEALNTLKTLCLVSREWRQAAVKYVFHTVEVTGQDRHTVSIRLHRLIDVLRESIDGSLEPKCASSLRSFSVTRNVEERFKFLDTRRLRSLEYMYGNGNLTDLFDILTKPDEISINCLRIDFGLENLAVDWEQLPLAFRISFETFLRSSSLQILSIRNVLNLPQSIFHQSSIKALQLAVWRLPSGESVRDSIINESIDAPQLDFLVMNDDCASVFLEASHWRAVLSKLKGCNVDLRYDFHKCTLEAARKSLEILRIDRMEWSNLDRHIPSSSSSSFNPFNFGNYPNLRTLSITRHRDDVNNILYIKMFGKEEPDEDIMKLVHLLGQSDCCPRLHTLSLHMLDFYDMDAAEDCFVPRPPPGTLNAWQELDKVIASSSRFPALRLFRLEMSAEVDPRSPLITLSPFDTTKFKSITIQSLEDSFTNTKARGVELDFIFEEIMVHYN